MQELSLKALRSFSGVAAVEPWARTTALVIIDMQNRLAKPDGFTVTRLRQRGLHEAADQYLAQMATAIPNMASLLQRARDTGQPVIHVRVVAVPGASGGFAVTGTPSEHELAIVDELTPLPGEIVLDKACSGVFTGTNIDFILRRLGVDAIIFTGCVTDGCVEQSLRQAHDLEYACVLVSDATAALTDEVHVNALQRLEHRRAHIRTTHELLETQHIPATHIDTNVW